MNEDFKKGAYSMDIIQFDQETRHFLESLPIAIGIYQFINQKVHTVLLSQGFLDIFGLDDLQGALDLMNSDMYRDAHPDDVARIADIAYQFAIHSETYEAVYRNKNPYQDHYHIIHSSGKHIYYRGVRLAIIWYMDESRAQQEDNESSCLLKHMLFDNLQQEMDQRRRQYDDLTGLPQMNYFLTLASKGVKHLIDQGSQPAILYLDYSNFKAFNQHYGFAAGDYMIRELGRLVRSFFGAENGSRFESDHFAVYTALEGLEPKLNLLYEEIAKLNNHKSLPVRVGIYAESFDLLDLNKACDYAKQACDYLSGKNYSTSIFFNKDIQHAAEIKDYVITHFQEAMEKHWIQVYYQPVIHAISGTMCGSEALARWNDPHYGMIMPNSFIGALEETGQIYDLDLYIFEEVCHDYDAYRRFEDDVVPVSFNLSRRDFDHSDLIERIENIIQHYHVPHELINIEITESAFVEDVSHIGKVVDHFHALGYQVWMDDFGTGYSSLGILKDFAFDEIKIDMSFISNFTDKGKKIIESTVSMAKKIGVQTLAEGVETREQFEFLRQIGCEKIQGYYFGKPIPGYKMSEHCKTHDIPIVSLNWKDYYDAIGAINYLTDSSLAVVEDDGENFKILYMNSAFKEELTKDNIVDFKDWEKQLNIKNSPIYVFHRRFANEQLRKCEGVQTITYPTSHGYMELKASVVTYHEQYYIYKAQINHVQLSSNDELKYHDNLLKNLYYLYSDVALIDLEHDTIEGVISSLSSQPIAQETITNLHECVQTWEENYVVPEERERFRNFCNPDQLYDRFMKEDQPMLIDFFHSRRSDGHYECLMHVVLPVVNTKFKKLLYVTIPTGQNNDERKQMSES